MKIYRWVVKIGNGVYHELYDTKKHAEEVWVSCDHDGIYRVELKPTRKKS